MKVLISFHQFWLSFDPSNSQNRPFFHVFALFYPVFIFVDLDFSHISKSCLEILFPHLVFVFQAWLTWFFHMVTLFAPYLSFYALFDLVLATLIGPHLRQEMGPTGLWSSWFMKYWKSVCASNFCLRSLTKMCPMHGLVMGP